ncbi:MAG: hypothetical protein HFE87_09355 [Acutalibacter sp.]|nr:hypothetical protein [Acutalibacter sp.]
MQEVFCAVFAAADVIMDLDTLREFYKSIFYLRGRKRVVQEEPFQGGSWIKLCFPSLGSQHGNLSIAFEICQALAAPQNLRR